MPDTNQGTKAPPLPRVKTPLSLMCTKGTREGGWGFSRAARSLLWPVVERRHALQSSSFLAGTQSWLPSRLSALRPMAAATRKAAGGQRSRVQRLPPQPTQLEGKGPLWAGSRPSSGGGGRGGSGVPSVAPQPQSGWTRTAGHPWLVSLSACAVNPASPTDRTAQGCRANLPAPQLEGLRAVGVHQEGAGGNHGETPPPKV